MTETVRQPAEQVRLGTLKPIEGVLDVTSGLYGMQYEVRILASVNLDASPYRRVTLRGDFTNLPFRDATFNTVLFDPPHTIDTRNTLFGTLNPHSGLGPHIAAFKYGCYRTVDQLRKAVYRGASEACRVLTVDGTMIFKWSNSEKPFSWATDTVEKAAPRLFKYKLHIRKSGSHTQNQTWYVWYRKK